VGKGIMSSGESKEATECARYNSLEGLAAGGRVYKRFGELIEL
jgi:hypothetical protein